MELFRKAVSWGKSSRRGGNKVDSGKSKIDGMSVFSVFFLEFNHGNNLSFLSTKKLIFELCLTIRDLESFVKSWNDRDAASELSRDCDLAQKWKTRHLIGLKAFLG